MSQQTKEFQIYFGSKYNDIDSDTFVTSLFSVSTILQEINKELSPEKKIQVKVKALSPGSFDVMCFLIEQASALVPLFTAQNLDYFKNLIEILVKLHELKKHLGGEPPKRKTEVDNGDYFEIENMQGDITKVENIVVNQYFGNQIIQDAITKNFDRLNSDENIQSYEYKIDDKTTFKSDRNDFIDLKKKIIVDTTKVKELILTDQQLHMYKLVWDDNNKWGFVWNGIKIQAFIKDRNFFKRIDDGEKFAKGDILEVDLKVYQVFDHSLDSYINDSYEVIKVEKHIPRSEQPNLIIEK